MDMRRSIAPPPGGEFTVEAAARKAAETPVQAAATQVHDPEDRRGPQGVTVDAGAPQPHTASTASLALTAVGIVFGDIGTSPLYAFSVALSATGQALPVAADVFGIVSLIFWALIVMVSLKYVVLILRADNEGEGGILALLSLVAGDRIAWSPRIPLMVILGVIGAALLYGDGVITPAISVL
jgi:KUP system potassium uptake protein